jgi:hypothetical protein
MQLPDVMFSSCPRFPVVYAAFHNNVTRSGMAVSVVVEKKRLDAGTFF